MNRNAKTWIILVTLIVVAFLVTLWATSTSWFVISPWQRRPWEPPPEIPWDIELFYTAKAVISAINVTLAVFLLLTYINIYQKTRSEFTIGLIIFSAVFLLNALASNPLVIWVFGFTAIGLGPFAMLPELFTCGALIALLYLSVKY